MSIIIYRVGHFNFSTLITRKRSIFAKNTREESCIILRGKEASDLEFGLESIFHL